MPHLASVAIRFMRGPLAPLLARRMAPAPPADMGSLRLAADDSGEASSELWYRSFSGALQVRNVVRPSLTPILPDTDARTGAAMIVLPGGGFDVLEFENEGLDVARFLAEHGICAYVLKYRLTATPVDDKKFIRHVLSTLLRFIETPTTRLPVLPYAAADAISALAAVRSDADRLGVDRNKVGLIGFSAGAITALAATLAAEDGDGPNALGYIYGPMEAVDVPSPAPPLFVSIARNDGIFTIPEHDLTSGWRKSGAEAQLHVYASGGHGYGLGKPENASRAMRSDLRDWLVELGYAAPPVDLT